MTVEPVPEGDIRTLADPLAESLRVVRLADERGLLVRLMGGMAIRAHAPDWPARTRRRKSRSVGGDQAAPDTVLADVPVLQG